MQTLTLEGYLAADPSILSAQGSGKKRASFRVVETTRFRRANGEPGERTTGFNCICFNEATAENYIQPYARKGMLLELRQDIAEPGQFGRGKEAVPTVVLVAFHPSRGVGLHELPLNGEREDTAQQSDRARGGMNTAASVRRRLSTNASRPDIDHQPLDVRSADIGDLHLAQAGFDVAGDADAIDPKGRRFLHRHALLHVEVAELRHGQFFASFDFGPLRVTT